MNNATAKRLEALEAKLAKEIERRFPPEPMHPEVAALLISIGLAGAADSPNNPRAGKQAMQLAADKITAKAKRSHAETIAILQTIRGTYPS